MARSLRLLTGIAFVLAFAASAQEATFTSTHPSPLKRSGLIKPNETTFKGTIQISGSFDVIWEPGTEGDPGYFRVVLKPDKKSQEILPYDSERGPVREIWLRNTDTSMRAFLSPAQRKAAANSHARHSTGHVTVMINSYRTSVDCDQRGYNALLVAVVKQPSHVATNAPINESTGGC